MKNRFKFGEAVIASLLSLAMVGCNGSGEIVLEKQHSRDKSTAEKDPTSFKKLPPQELSDPDQKPFHPELNVGDGSVKPVVYDKNSAKTVEEELRATEEAAKEVKRLAAVLSTSAWDLAHVRCSKVNHLGEFITREADSEKIWKQKFRLDPTSKLYSLLYIYDYNKNGQSDLRHYVTRSFYHEVRLDSQGLNKLVFSNLPKKDEKGDWVVQVKKPGTHYSKDEFFMNIEPQLKERDLLHTPASLRLPPRYFQSDSELEFSIVEGQSGDGQRLILKGEMEHFCSYLLSDSAKLDLHFEIGKDLLNEDRKDIEKIQTELEFVKVENKRAPSFWSTWFGMNDLGFLNE